MDGKFTLEIELGNAEMNRRAHLIRALRDVASRIERDAGAPEGAKIMDVNGNTVGRWEYKREG